MELELQEEIDLEPELLPRVKRVKTKMLEILPTIHEHEETDTLLENIKNPEILIVEKPKKGRKKKSTKEVKETSLETIPEETSLETIPEETSLETIPETISEKN
jgi:hypothetical protein